MSTIQDLIQATLANEPVAASDHFGEMMASRIASRIDAMVPEVASQLFADDASGE